MSQTSDEKATGTDLMSGGNWPPLRQDVCDMGGFGYVGQARHDRDETLGLALPCAKRSGRESLDQSMALIER